MAAQKRGISPYKYITTVTRNEFELEITGWLSSVFYPVGEIMKSVMGDSSGGSSSRPPSQTEVGPDDGSEEARRERSASKRYSWHRTTANRRYNVYNLDARDPGQYNAAMNKLKREFASQGK